MSDTLTTFQQFLVEIREGSGANFSFLHKLIHLGPGFFDRSSGVIRPVKLIEVDALQTQPAKRSLAFTPYGFGLEHSIRLFHPILPVPDEAAFREDVGSFGFRQLT